MVLVSSKDNNVRSSMEWTVRSSERPPRLFQPYETSTRETPMIHMMLQPFCLSQLLPLFKLFYRIRWFASYPLRTRLLPKFIPVTVSGTEYIANLTVGELLLTVPLIILFLKGYHFTYGSPNVNDGGFMAAYAIFLTYVTANRSNSIFSFLFGIPFERMINFHQLCSFFAVTLGCFHTYTAFMISGDSKYAQFRDNSDLAKFLIDGFVNTSGTIILGFMIGLVGLGIFPVLRRHLFNLWLLLHMILAIGVLVALFLHGVKSTVLITMWWGLDLFVRYAIMAGCRYRTKEAKIRRIGDSRDPHEASVEITFPKPPGFDYNAGQFVQIAIPAINIFEFHPITISSAPHEKVVTLHVRRLGDWTSKLLALTNDKENNQVTTEIWVEGPYGSLSVDLNDEKRYKMAMFIGGGIGITPCQSIAKDLLYQHHANGRLLKKIKFVWAARNPRIVEDMPPLGGTENWIVSQRSSYFSKNISSSLSTRTSSRKVSIEVHVHCTRACTDEENYAHLPYNMHIGRPDIENLVKEMKEEAIQAGEHSVAVFACGPKSLMTDALEACRRHSQSVAGCGDGVFFDVHIEHFEF